ncbi:MAG: YdcF family protein [Firmicutes bacterium]|nr:YdcF family protein [Bacillota bacterium]MBR2620355.1 YdcF family protein [Bacillota bacterium]MBR3787951.1 YdcF family protein [Bacillota bacterium]
MGIFIVIVAIAINLFMIKTTEDQIVSSYDGTSGSVSNETLVEISRIEPECIMVLGASVHPDGTPSPMLEDRLEAGIELYNRGVAPKLLLTGDNGQIEYNEVEAMKNYAVNAGVPEEDIFLDHAGFSTYDSVYRASYVFGVESMVAVTQEYHLYRTLHGCKKMGIEAVGIGADQEVYAGQEYREIREVLARVKDFVMWLIKPEATFLGEAIPISGSGIVTQ